MKSLLRSTTWLPLCVIVMIMYMSTDSWSLLRSSVRPCRAPDPSPLKGDIASELVAGVDRFLLKQLDESVKTRERYWKREFSSLKAYDASIEPNRKRLAHILGVRDPLTQSGTAEHPDDFSYQLVAGSGEPASVRSIRWRAFPT